MLPCDQICIDSWSNCKLNALLERTLPACATAQHHACTCSWKARIVKLNVRAMQIPGTFLDRTFQDTTHHALLNRTSVLAAAELILRALPQPSVLYALLTTRITTCVGGKLQRSWTSHRFVQCIDNHQPRLITPLIQSSFLA